jgi:hypothetical protein
MAAVKPGMNTFTREALINGEHAQIECLEIEGQTYTVSRSLTTAVRLEDEWFDDVSNPEAVIAALKQSSLAADIFTFWQRLPHTEPQFDFHREWEVIAALPVTNFEHWWNNQIKPATRNLIRKAEKKGVEVRPARYDDEFVRGMTEIFNEVPVRQGRRFWHYGKSFETVKRQFSRYLFREDLLGAYCGDELVGFVMLGDAGAYGVLGQIISKIQHRDKSPNNALIAKAVELCEKKKFSHLVYAYWGDGSLIDFKRHNGFVRTQLPRYWIPLTRKGQLAIRTGLHHGWRELVPTRLRSRLKMLRSRWVSHAVSNAKTSSSG